jgi:hypothetical protein
MGPLPSVLSGLLGLGPTSTPSGMPSTSLSARVGLVPGGELLRIRQAVLIGVERAVVPIQGVETAGDLVPVRHAVAVAVLLRVGDDPDGGGVIGLEFGAPGKRAFEFDEPADAVAVEVDEVVVELLNRQVDVGDAAVVGERPVAIAVEKGERIVTPVELVEGGKPLRRVDVAVEVEHREDDLQERLQVAELLPPLPHLPQRRRGQQGRQQDAAEQPPRSPRCRVHRVSPLDSVHGRRGRPMPAGRQRSRMGQVTNPNWPPLSVSQAPRGLACKSVSMICIT